MELHKTDEMMLELIGKLDESDAIFVVSKFVHDHDTASSPWVNKWMDEHEDWIPTMLQLHRQGKRIRFFNRMRKRFQPARILKLMLPLSLLLFAARALGVL